MVRSIKVPSCGADLDSLKSWITTVMDSPLTTQLLHGYLLYPIQLKQRNESATTIKVDHVKITVTVMSAQDPSLAYTFVEETC